MDEASLAANPGEYLDPGYDPQTPDDDNLLLSFTRAERALWRSWGEWVDAEIGSDDDAGVFWVDSRSASASATRSYGRVRWMQQPLLPWLDA